jgi:alkylation response protein AidB-like acyl-CoA dehydrogenase
MFMLARTDPDAPKHRGISFFMVDLKSPGVSLRPLIDMAWKHPFNETFFEDVRVPAKNLIGDENRGWYVGMTLLDFERSLVALSITYRRGLKDQIAAMQGPAKKFVRADFDTMRLEFVDRAIEAEVLYNFSLRIVSMNARGLVPNYEASVNKMFGSELHQRVARTGTKAWGLYGNVWDPKSPHAPMRATHVQDYVVSVPHTIYSGSNEIQRNVIATRGLGLPRG